MYLKRFYIKHYIMAKTIWSYISDWMNDNARNATDLDANVALVRFNRRYHEIEWKIATFIMDNYFDEYMDMDLVANKATYDLPTWDSSWSTLPDYPELRKLLELSADYNGNWKFIKADELPDWDLKQPLEWYSDHASTRRPYFKFEWKDQITLYPTPKHDVEWWLRIRYASNTPDVVATDDETNLTIPRQYIHIILMWMSWDNARAVNDVKNVMMYKQDYYQAMNEMMAELSDRYIQPTQYHIPNLRWLMN